MAIPLLIGLLASAVAGKKIIDSQVDKLNAAKASVEEGKKRCEEEISNHTKSRRKSAVQKRMFDLLLAHAFSDSDKNETPPASDWPHLSDTNKIVATRQYSMFSWKEYSFFTTQAIHYHNAKTGTHELLYYDCIDSYDPINETVKYRRPSPQGEIVISKKINHWKKFEQDFIQQIAHIWAMESEKDTSVLEFCFNRCDDFEKALSFFKTRRIKNRFANRCSGKSPVLRENFEHIQIVSMKNGKIELRYWRYIFNNEDAEWMERDACIINDKLYRLRDEIAEVFQQALYDLFGVFFEKENITFLKEADLSYEGPSISDKLNDLQSKAESCKEFMRDYVEKNCK